MNKNGADPPQSDYETISPVVVDITSAQDQVDNTLTRQVRLLPWIVVALMLALLAVVVLVLPSLVEAPAPESPLVQQSTNPTTPRAGSTAPASSPWEEAQRAQAREDAKAALDEILQAQFTLQDQGVTNWAPEAFAAALALAQSGDEAYRSEDFTGAQSIYVEAGKQLNALLDQAPKAFQRLLETGQQALLDGDAALASTAFEAALRIHPNDGLAARGLERAMVLDRVLAETRSARDALGQQDLTGAAAAYSRALELDADHVPAQKGLQAVRAQQQEQAFGAAMSAGYAALAEADYQRARKEFTKAGKIRPGAAEAREAIAQVEAANTLVRIERLLSGGDEAAITEDWDTAVEKYQAALDIDQGLARAQESLANAGTRQRLDRLVQEVLDEPMVLVDEKRYQTSRALFRSARQVPEAGARLTDQLQRLELILRDARTPVQVRFASDNKTEVSVLRIQQLGKFDSTQLTLNPGPYVVIGRRQGYRDVREEIVINPGSTPLTVDIRCSEPI